ncbi:MAG: nickel transporter [Hyphomicrobium zavarzinii]|jgi:phosphoribosylformimino-5-aminoimidazole carboxamide ribotide isomerase|uniref:Putative formaldeyhyde oxidation protein n=1 Tax=Hyphomicrobium zavarzinii TaxID=48292 RepID=Q6R957_9HYPH|nr:MULTISPECIES: HisA/HisF-related TIM barrel protein [Hyphomicrobium]AAS86343.1 putative formaldeyhyde oxidation protein [Hyphomicrobium zavarzinii]MBL8844874.1 nickel transporter [Hyphomicrobium zavarzinii]WBT36807.1 HisA/HisF-related TIM barrel protein [Hyphomicrobium sp. DMF-1]HML41685.1 HisA/HisF-related TIM barrel protein [Hyphomicrobium zavarzinii]
MEIIPVIDVRGGLAVAASRGDRANYRPLVTPLAGSADPVAVALGLSRLFPFRKLYVADLEGIEARGADYRMQQRLAASWPGTELWIDDGGAGTQAPLGDNGPPAAIIKSHVLGSESLSSIDDYERARKAAGPAAPLSLDFRGDDFIGPPGLLEDAALWPDRVIVMTLARVGSGEGPDLPRLDAVVSRAAHRAVYAAGGVRSVADLASLRDIGVAGALVATALHGGAITSRDIEAIA